MAGSLLTADLPHGGGWRRQLRRALNDTLNVRIFGSEFRSSGTGAPKFDHDRCERSVQMRLYTLSKGQFALVFAVCLLAFVIFLMIGLAGPPITSVRQRRAKELPNANTTNMAVGPIVISSPVLSTYCQQLWVIGRFYTSASSQSSLHEIYDASFYVNVEVFATSTYVDTADLPMGDRKPEISHNHSAILRCQNSVCDEIIVAHLGFVEYVQYHFVYRFYGLQVFNQRFAIEDIVFYFKSYNPSFTRMEIWFRFGFAVLAILATIWFHRNLRPYPLFHWSLEQKWVAALLPLLVLFNDPLFPLVFLFNNALPSIIDSIFQSTFLCALLMFWLCIYHGIKQTSRPFLTFYLPKLILVSLIWLVVIIMAILHRVAALANVGDGQSSYEASQGIQIFFYIMGGFYLIYLMILIFRSCKELRRLPYFDLRLKFFTTFVFVVIGITIAISGLRYGVTPMLEDNFVSHLSTSYSSSAEFMAFYGLLNCYLLTMAFVYSPNPNVVAELQMMEQPPPSAAALLNNDSEDELYGPELTNKNLHVHFGEGESDGD